MRQYPSKLLLFGEHILLVGARALAVPVPVFSGQWTWRQASDPPAPWSERLRAFAHSPELSAAGAVDVSAFQQELSAGLYFQSSIPVGYGMGSSGALCAAVYDRYATSKTEDLAELKAIFARLESYFHGQSSGVDPLASYLNHAIWISNRTEVSLASLQRWSTNQPVVFLLDTGIPRQTGPLVRWFLEQSKEDNFARSLENILFPAHQAVLEAWQTGNADAFWPALREVSAFQLRYMPPMIPASWGRTWEDCLCGTDVALKICGAGGGGFILGFAVSKAAVLEKFGTFNPVLPFDGQTMVEK